MSELHDRKEWGAKAAQLLRQLLDENIALKAKVINEQRAKAAVLMELQRLREEIARIKAEKI